jgi:hypothetical protein
MHGLAGAFDFFVKIASNSVALPGLLQSRSINDAGPGYMVSEAL